MWTQTLADGLWRIVPQGSCASERFAHNLLLIGV